MSEFWEAKMRKKKGVNKLDQSSIRPESEQGKRENKQSIKKCKIRWQK